MGEDRLEQLQATRLGQGAQPRPHPSSGRGIVVGHPQGPRAPGDADGGQAPIVATAGEAVEGCVGGGVGGLGRGSEAPGGRGEQREQVEIVTLGQGVEVGGAEDLRGEDRPGPIGGLIGDQGIVEDPRCVDDPPQGQTVDDGRQRVAIGHVR